MITLKSQNTISLYSVILILLTPWIGEVHAAGADDLPECEFDVILDLKLLCEIHEPEVRRFYQPDQKFCACPFFSECISQEVENLHTHGKELQFLCFKKPTYADKKHEDMTMGLLRDEELIDDIVTPSGLPQNNDVGL